MGRLRRILGVLLLTALIGIGIFATAYQFNDGKINQAVIGSIFLGMAFPNFFVAGVMRLFRHRAGFYFLWTALACALIGVVILVFR
ncbi:MAG: hypothetical protein IT262_21470 [Saprospiraceae bacterium]|nr:hypothetical protein [Saprospiraceae bacterium]